MSQSVPPPPASDPESNPPPAPTTSPEPRREKNPLRSSRTSGANVAMVASIALVVLLVVFIVQNTESTDIEFLGFDGSAPLSVALLVAAAVGMAIAAMVSSLRIIQLRRRVKREQKSARR